MATVSRVNVRPADDGGDRWDLADPGYVAARLPAPVAFEIEAIVSGPEAEQEAPVEATAWMDDPRGVRVVAPQPMRWSEMAGTSGVVWRRRVFLAVHTEFAVPGIYTNAVELKGAEPVERGFRVVVKG